MTRGGARASGLRSAPARPPAASLARQVIVKAMIKDGKIAKWSYYGESARCASIFVDGVEGMSK